ncbi:hypothetical protein Tco_0490648 [Tanacetum coccineum]
MSDSEDSTVTYTKISNPYEDLSDIGSPRAEEPIFQDPPSLDYVPDPEEPEQTPPSPIYVPFVPEPVYPKFLLEDDVLPAKEQPLPVAASPTTESPRYIPESNPKEDPEEDPADYPADRGDDRDNEEPSDDDDDDDDDAEEEEHLAPADPAAVAYSADQDPYLAYRVTARMSIRPQAPAPFLSEEVAERLLALPTPPPSPLSPYSSPLPQIPSPPLPIPSPPPNSPTYVEGSLGSRAAGIRQRDALPSPVHETEMPEICLPLRKRPCRTTPGPGYEVGESSAAGEWETEREIKSLAEARFLAQQRAAEIRSRPPIRTQLRNQMMTYLKHVRGKIHSDLKTKNFCEIQSCKKRRMTYLTGKKEEESTRKRKLVLKTFVNKEKRSQENKIQTRYSQDDNTDSEKENDELRLCLTIAPDKDKEVDYEILDKKYPIIEWKYEHLGIKPQYDEAKDLEEINLNVVIRSSGQRRYFSTLMKVLSIFDRDDLNVVYQLVIDIYKDEYPLRKKVLVQMLELKLESEEDNTMAWELIRFVKKLITELEL